MTNMCYVCGNIFTETPRHGYRISPYKNGKVDLKKSVDFVFCSDRCLNQWVYFHTKPKEDK